MDEEWAETGGHNCDQPFDDEDPRPLLAMIVEDQKVSRDEKI